jgi:hypothetical protein
VTTLSDTRPPRRTRVHRGFLLATAIVLAVGSGSLARAATPEEQIQALLENLGVMVPDVLEGGVGLYWRGDTHSRMRINQYLGAGELSHFPRGPFNVLPGHARSWTSPRGLIRVPLLTGLSGRKIRIVNPSTMARILTARIPLDAAEFPTLIQMCLQAQSYWHEVAGIMRGRRFLIYPNRYTNLTERIGKADDGRNILRLMTRRDGELARPAPRPKELYIPPGARVRMPGPEPPPPTGGPLPGEDLAERAGVEAAAAVEAEAGEEAAALGGRGRLRKTLSVGKPVAMVGIVQEVASLFVPDTAVAHATRHNIPLWDTKGWRLYEIQPWRTDPDNWFWHSNSGGGWTGMRKVGNVGVGLINMFGDPGTILNLPQTIVNPFVTGGQGWWDGGAALLGY